MREESDTPDPAVARIAGRQHGVVTAGQLRDAGIDKSAVTRRVRAGRLHRLHRGVYAVGHSAPSWYRRWMAAVLACGERAVLSHHSAAALWELLHPIDGPVHVSTPSTAGRLSRRGIRVHRCPSLALAVPSLTPSSKWQGGGRERGDLITRRHNIPVTTVQRTIEDLEGTIAPHLFRRAKRQAEHRGIRLEGVESTRLRSDLEEDFLALFLEHRFPHPETNVKLGRHEVDFLWRDERVVVEADTFLYHRGSVCFESDYDRDLDLRSGGYAVLRFNDVQLEEEPARVVADLARALDQAAARQWRAKGST